MGHLIWDKPGILDHKLSSYLILDLCLNLFFNILLYSYYWIPPHFEGNSILLEWTSHIWRWNMWCFGWVGVIRIWSENMAERLKNWVPKLVTVTTTLVDLFLKLTVFAPVNFDGKLLVPSFLGNSFHVFWCELLVSRRVNLVLLTVKNLVAQ